MIRNVKRTWFEVWGTEEAQNRLLKALLVFLLALCISETVALVILALRKPPVIAVSGTQSRVLKITPPSAELLDAEVRRVVTSYVDARTNWDVSTVTARLQEAARFVHPDFAKKFAALVQDQVRIAQEKKLSQRFYVSDLVIDSKARTARVTGDRILMIEGLRAASSVQFELQYEFGDRTEANPEGAYIAGDKPLAGDGGGR